MKIILKSLTLQNFKGIRSLNVNFNPDVTSIFGQNEAGKTTLLDSFLWVLSDKNSQDTKDFSIKTLDSNNEPLHKVEHSVEAVFSIDGFEEKFKKIYREKWTKHRGSAEDVFSGHESIYFHQDVPVSATDFQKKVDILIPKEILRLLTNVYYFNTVLDWKQRREMIFKLAGEITDKEIAAGKPEFEAILNIRGSLQEYKAQTSAKKQLLIKQLKEIPARIDEVNKGIPAPVNIDEINQLITGKELKLAEIDTQIQNITEAYNTANLEFQKKKERILALRSEYTILEYEAKKELNKDLTVKKTNRDQLVNGISTRNANITSLNNEINLFQTTIARLTDEKDKLTQAWHTENAKTLTFAEGQFNCPACSRPLEETDIEAKKTELTTTFNKNKASALLTITEQGKAKAASIAEIITKVDQANKDILTNQEWIDKFNTELETIGTLAEEITTVVPDAKMQAIIDEGTKLKEEVATAPVIDTKALKESKVQLTIEIELLKPQRTINDQIEKAKTRIAELQTEERKLSQEIANFERIEFNIDAFTKAKVEIVEGRINSMFSLAKFKMYEILINGSESPCAITLVNGVPYSDLNTGAKIQVGIDIINTFSKHFNIYAPCWLDNRESVTNIPETNCQIINLIVSPNDKVLRIE